MNVLKEYLIKLVDLLIRKLWNILQRPSLLQIFYKSLIRLYLDYNYIIYD